MSIPIDRFLEAVEDVLGDYAAEVTDGVQDAVKAVAKDTVREVRKRSPVDSGAYKKSWGQTTTKETPGSIIITIHNRKHYRLTHLLENGHALVGGGRTRAQPHIAPAEKAAEKELLRQVQVKIKGAGG